MMRDHMMGWVLPAEAPGPAIRPVTLSKTEREAYLTEDALRRFETGDHMLPGMKQSDFPKEYDTRAAIDDRVDAAYDRAMRDMALHPFPQFGFDEAKAGGDMSAVCVRDAQGHIQSVMVGDWGVGFAGMPEYKAEQRAKNDTATGMRLLQEQAETWRKRAMSEMRDNRKLTQKFGW